MSFVPRLLTHRCEDCDESIRRKSCISSGKYCLLKPRDTISKDSDQINESSLLEEGIRERCIYYVLEEQRAKANQTSDDLHLLFNYMYDIRLSCIEKDFRVGLNCSNRIMK